MAGYRQWNLSSDCIVNNPQLNNQIYRYNKILEISTTGIQKFKNVVIMMDDNIDTLNNFTTINRCRNSNIKELRDIFLVNNTITCLNKEPTFSEEMLY